MSAELPILYSFRRCPYAIRARLALCVSAQRVELREVRLSQKVAEFVQVSTRSTVPVLLLPNAQVLEESLDIMRWALQINDPLHWFQEDIEIQTQQLIDENDGVFKLHLDHYKYSDRYPQHSQLEYRLQAECFLQKLEGLLQQSPYLLSTRATLVDMALMPFIRQFAGVDSAWFSTCEYSRLRGWLNGMLATDLFSSVMEKYAFWQAGDGVSFFPPRQ